MFAPDADEVEHAHRCSGVATALRLAEYTDHVLPEQDDEITTLRHSHYRGSLAMRPSCSVGLVAVLAIAAAVGCEEQPAAPDSKSVTAIDAPLANARSGSQCTGCDDTAVPSALLAEANVELARHGLAILKAEYVTASSSGQMGVVLFANDRGNKQLEHDFVPFDPRRGGRTNITYVVDAFDGATTNGLTAGDTEDAISRAMSTWDAVTCSDLSMTQNTTTPFDIGIVQSILGFGGFDAFVPWADVIHAGWLPGGFFDLIEPDGSTFILGITFTIVFVNPDGTGTDIDGNGKTDVGFREIYYNDAFPWGIDSSELDPVDPAFDVETVALHEAGHGLSQAHFGRIFGTLANLKLHFAPQAVMNASVFGQKQSLLGSDNGGHCSNWANWPNG